MTNILIANSIEEVLLKNGSAEFEILNKKLQENNNYSLFDCCDNPEYLDIAIKQVYGDSHHEIIGSIQKKLLPHVADDKIELFIIKLLKIFEKPENECQQLFLL